jgi:CheY-like chemotaxis protein
VSATPTVYFIDDSATMREVIKIAFRRENINVVAYPDANSALAQIEISAPDVLITDVIMPDKDGYEVCQYVKQHPRLGNTPVILMSGVVNRAVAEKAFAVKADELIRKPFQPQDLITRVKHLLPGGGPAAPAPVSPPSNAAAALSSIFQGAKPAAAPVPATVPAPAPRAVPAPAAVLPMAPVPQPVFAPTAAAAAPAPARVPAPTPMSGDIQKMKLEISRLEALVKKLQNDLISEREYARALEAHVKTLQEAE